MSTYKGFLHDKVRNKTKEWWTPPFIFEALGIEFDLDPCSPGKRHVPWIPAKSHFTIKGDGLKKAWFGRVWMNPPYSTQTIKWIKKLAEHGNGVALVYARTDTVWFHQYALQADAMCFLSKRIKFIRSEDIDIKGGGAGAGSVLIGFGEKCAQAVLNCGLGWCVRLRE